MQNDMKREQEDQSVWSEKKQAKLFNFISTLIDVKCHRLHCKLENKKFQRKDITLARDKLKNNSLKGELFSKKFPQSNKELITRNLK
jgi:hypothetical protein